jgi:hypothetical protein
VDCSPPPSAKVKNDELLVVAFMVCRDRDRERERDLYIQSITETNKLLLQLYSGKTLSAIVFDRRKFRVCVCSGIQLTQVVRVKILVF